MSFCILPRLLAKTEGLDDSTIAIDIAVVQIVEQCAALSYQLGQCPCGSMIFTVFLQMLRQMGNTVGEQCYLALS